MPESRNASSNFGHRDKQLPSNRANPMKPFIILVLLCCALLRTQAQDASFTYQGRLNANGSPANGVYDFTFQAFDAPAAGSSIGTASVSDVDVTNAASANAQLAANAVSAGNFQNSTITAGMIASGQVVKSLNGLTDGVSLT
jgi:hypothetical protein